MLESFGAKERPEANILRTEAAAAELSTHPWPGNVRELRNYVERCLALAARGPLASESTFAKNASQPAAGDEPSPRAGLRSARQSFMREFERRYLEQLLAEQGGNVSAAARAAGIDRKYLYRLLWRNGLR